MSAKHRIRHSGPTKPKLCGGKRSYKTQQQAMTVLQEQELLTAGLKLKIYHCSSCRSYHLSRQFDQ